MKNNFIYKNPCSLLLISILFCLNVQAQKDTIYDAFEIAPEFPGGIDSMNIFLSSNLNYPDLAIDSNYAGTIYVKFIVRKSGKIENPIIAKSVIKCLVALL